MNKCHYTYVKSIGKVLIPCCWAVVISQNMEDCTCRLYPETYAQFERKEYNEKLSEQKKYIGELEKEVNRLNRILRKVNGFR